MKRDHFEGDHSFYRLPVHLGSENIQRFTQPIILLLCPVLFHLLYEIFTLQSAKSWINKSNIHAIKCVKEEWSLVHDASFILNLCLHSDGAVINKSDNHVEEIHINLKNNDKNFTKNSSEEARQSII